MQLDLSVFTKGYTLISWFLGHAKYTCAQAEESEVGEPNVKLGLETNKEVWLHSREYLNK